MVGLFLKGQQKRKELQKGAHKGRMAIGGWVDKEEKRQARVYAIKCTFHLYFILLYTQVKSEDILFRFFVLPQMLTTTYRCVGPSPHLSSHFLLL